MLMICTYMSGQLGSERADDSNHELCQVVMADMCQVMSEWLHDCSGEMAVDVGRPWFVPSMAMSLLELGCVHACDCVQLWTCWYLWCCPRDRCVQPTTSEY